jgi:hypothetical protein
VQQRIFAMFGRVNVASECWLKKENEKEKKKGGLTVASRVARILN